MASKSPQAAKPNTESGSKQIENKSGRLSKSDKAKIDEMLRFGKPVEEIAVEVRKNINIVEDYILIDKEGISQEQLSIIEALRKKPEYKQWRIEMSRDELAQFEYHYARLLPQFDDGDLTPAEEDQIVTMVKIQLAIHRNEVERYRSKVKIDEYYDRIDVAVSDDEPLDKVAQLKTLLDGEGVTSKKLLDQYNLLLQRQSDSLKYLKATREQRKKNIEDRRVNFVDIIKSLMDKDKRRQQGIEIDIMRKAAEAETSRLSKSWTYMDGSTDKPIYNAESA